MQSSSLGFVLMMSTALTACATFKPPQVGYDDEQPAVLQSDPPKPVQVVEVPKPLPLPGQLKRGKGRRGRIAGASRCKAHCHCRARQKCL